MHDFLRMFQNIVTKNVSKLCGIGRQFSPIGTKVENICLSSEQQNESSQILRGTK